MRPKNPSEQPIHRTYRNTDGFFGRIQKAVITDVNEETGTCSIAWESTPGERRQVNLPFYVHFSTKGKRRKSAWQRTMPQAGDLVLVGFDSNSTARIVGYDSLGYDQLKNIQDEEGKFGFQDLKAGEFDQKSSGGAYYRGDALGTLFLAGGMTSLTLDKKNYELRVNSGLTKETLGTSTFRRGVVKRSPLPFQPELPAKAGLGVLPFDKLGPASAVAGDLYEFTADLRAAAAPSSPLAQKIALFSLGNVMDPFLSLPVVGDAYAAASAAGIMKFKVNPTSNARLLLRIYDSVPLVDTPIGTEGPVGGTVARPFELGVDQLGNAYINVGGLATHGLNIWSSNHVSISSNLLHLSGNVFLGGSPVGLPAPGVPPLMNSPVANQPLMCGTIFNAAMTAFLEAVVAFSGEAAAGAAVTTPVEAVAYCKVIGAAAAKLGAAATAMAAVQASWLSASAFCAPSAVGPGVVPPVSPFLL